IDGIPGPVDLDRFHGSLDELEVLAGVARRPAAAPRDLTATPDGETMALSWGMVEGATGYQVALRYRRGASWIDYHRYESAAAALEVKPEIELATFRFTVTACNHSGCSRESKARTFEYKR